MMTKRQSTLIVRMVAGMLGAASPAALFAQTAPAPAAPSVPTPEAPPPVTDLAAGFRNPPASARPRVWWHWMNGNVTKDGIAKDIAWMSRVGIGGLQNFDAALQTPQIVDKRLVYMTPEWKDAFRFAAEQAEQKGLELAVAASPGWSETGGPWVKPADAMKKLVWSEVVVEGGKALSRSLPAPPGSTGPFQDAPRTPNMAATPTGKPDPVYYADVAVLAFPEGRRVDERTPRFTTGDGKELSADVLTDARLTTTVDIPNPTAQQPSAIVADFGAPRQVRSLTFSLGRAIPSFGVSAPAVSLEAEGEAGGWRKLADVPVDGAAQTTVAFAPTRARRFRVVIAASAGGRGMGDLGSVPGAVIMAFGPSQAPATMAVAEMRLSDEERVDRFEVKAGFGLVPDYYALARDDLADAKGVAPDRVIDLTTKLRSDGTLDWQPPAGRWRIVRLGTSLVGTTNHPATAEATGLEVDKYDSAAVARYLDTYLGMVRGAAGDDLFGARGLRALVTDSIEVGPSNWTPTMVAQFKASRGYDPTPWLPVLTGTVIGSRAESDRFLFDYRATLAELISSQHYAKVAEVAHAGGLKVYGEALEDGRPTLGDDIAMRAHADVPMAALWTYAREKGPRVGLLGDMKGAASVAHLYGQNVAAAESLTAAFSPWAFGPRDLKPTMDLELVYGINRPVIHTSIHQPEDTKLPGLSLGPFGQYFNRHETWAEMARPWVDYIARSSFMLQQGRYFADVAYFYGEDAPLTVLYDKSIPADLPVHYAFDFVNSDGLARELTNEGGDLVARSGARYRVLYLGGTSRRMTLSVLKRVAALVEAGATVVGLAPTGSPSLADDTGEYRRLVARMWGGGATTTLGRGRAIASTSVEQALGGIGVTPDFVPGRAAPGDVLFLHRRLADGDVYFLTNRTAGPLRLDARFRVAGKAPELWHADTGTSEPVSYRTDGTDTIVPLELAGDEAVFVVFRTPAVAPSATVARPDWRQDSTIEGAWDVAFQPGRGAPAATRLARLGSLSGSATPGIRYFSGTATYSRSFVLPKGARPGAPLMLDLGEVGDVAQVLVNGRDAGIAWKAPYRLDIGSLVKPGSNRIEVRVADLWVNRLVGDAQPGAAKVAWTALPTYLPTAPLRPSGLIGPVTLMVPASSR